MGVLSVIVWFVREKILFFADFEEEILESERGGRGAGWQLRSHMMILELIML